MLQENYGLDLDVASYLNRAYGDQAPKLAELSQQGYNARLAEGHAYIEAEVIYAANHEAARSTIDILSRRTRLAFLDAAGAKQAITRVSHLLSEILNWSAEQRDADTLTAEAVLT